MCAMDLIDLKPVFKAVFNFRDTPIFVTQNYKDQEESRFDDAGYDSSNFFLLLGPILFIVPAYLIFLLVKKLA